MNQDEALTPRYSRQIKFPGIGIAGQRKLATGRALIIGCGALGSAIANLLARAGVGFLRIVDRDFVDLSNLQRQVLYDEADVAEGLPKAIAAAKRLSEINSEIEIDPVVADVTAGNLGSLCDSIDVILDGSDNFEVRFLINDAAVKFQIPWIYGGCLGADGQTMSIQPGDSACLHCLMLNGPPPPGTTETCDSFGVLAPIINLIASIETLEAIKILSGNHQAVSRKLQVFSMWKNESRCVDLTSLREQVDCPTCQQHQFPWLEGKRGSKTAILCGRNAVQLSFPDQREVDLGAIADRLQELGRVRSNEYLVRFDYLEYELTLFGDGRAIVSGTDDPALARKLYAQFFGQ